ncbi:hypothetical protein KIPE111705_27225 [Kibdelosporangium persicum]|uniref:Uncharacterized protein n=1 Tax=Kibdelosporangium persicum TaxID=2698649 RepID=A0ABX2EWV6_9PSEU|nr:hypothetical protein [Kibdelosporangium persicum]NRN63290.1 hypothetical protein [Kibdelosporangium persicum]
MFRKSATLAVAVLLAALASGSSASAAQQRLEVQLEPGFFITERDGIWYGSDYVSYNEFTVRAKAPHGRGNVRLFLSLPHQIHVLGHEGDGWTCRDVTGGIECDHHRPIAPGAEWPTLLVRIDPDCERTIRDSFDAYADGNHHFGVPFICYPTGT